MNKLAFARTTLRRTIFNSQLNSCKKRIQSETVYVILDDFAVFPLLRAYFPPANPAAIHKQGKNQNIQNQERNPFATRSHKEKSNISVHILNGRGFL